ncbi:MAG: F0F1 ATP synthase subunit A [Acidobacteria bacterium]|nr:F0F1 ATP synthase subunit A [Acidobacteriota bacterium]
MEHELWFTALLNRLLAGPVTGLLNTLGIQPESPAHPIPNYVSMQVFVALIIMSLLAWLRSRLSVDRPGTIQQIMELATDGLGSQSEEIIGHSGRRFLPLVFTLGIFILLSNLLGIVPTLETPTDQISVTLGCALVAFCYYNYWGLRRHGGLHYALTLTGPTPSMAHDVVGGGRISFGSLLTLIPVFLLGVLMFLIELVSHLARVLSLSVRLMANMIAGHNISLIFMSLVPIAVPVVFEGLHIFVGSLQAYIFMLLTMVYLSGAVSEEH